MYYRVLQQRLQYNVEKEIERRTGFHKGTEYSLSKPSVLPVGSDFEGIHQQQISFDGHTCEVRDKFCYKRMLSETENIPLNKISEGTCGYAKEKASCKKCLTPLDAQFAQSRSSSISPSEMIGDKFKLFSFPWRRRSTSFNITPKWAFRRFRYVKTPHIFKHFARYK